MQFHWLVFFDAATPDTFKDKIAEYDAFTPVFIDGLLSDRRIAEAVRTHVRLDATHLITTRLDTDDAIGDEYLAAVQAQFKGQEREFINVPLGYEWHAGRLYHRMSLSNQFISLIERLSAPDATPQTVHCAPHHQLRSTGEVRQVWTRPMWLVSFHGSNTEGERLGIRRIDGAVPERFARQTHLPLEAESLPARLGDLCRSTARLAGLSAKHGGKILLRP